MKLVYFLVAPVSIFASPNCEEITTCTGLSKIDKSLDWSIFTSLLSASSNATILTDLAYIYGSHAGIARECRMGLAAVFYSLSKIAIAKLEFQRSHNLNQLAMAMVWDVSRSHHDCLASVEVFGIRWLDEFMNEYLTLASHLRRHEDDGLPPPVPAVEQPTFRIGVATVCEYPESHKLFGIDKVSKGNRDQYVGKHGYVSVFKTVNEDAPGRHPVWSALALPLRLLETDAFDYVMWMDCDALFIDQDRKIEEIIRMQPRKDLYISEDGRGLSGGNWIVRNSQWSKSLLRSVLANPDFDKFDLKDQFGLLWTLLRPGAEFIDTPLINLGYPEDTALVPQRLINAYPWSLCRPSHHCFEDGKDFIVSFITLSSLSSEMAFTLLNSFATRSG